MTSVRVFLPLILTAALAACSGNLGGGQSTLPGTPPGGTNVQQVAPVAATPTPNSASNVATVGDNVAPQALPMVMGWGGSIAFSKPAAAPSSSPNPKSTATASDTAGAAVSVGITAGVVEPADSPHFGSASTKRRAKHDPTALTPLLFISLLATSDLTLDEFPSIAIDVPRDIAAKHRDDTYALALYDPEQKSKSYRLAIAERDLSSPLPGSAPAPVSTPVPTPIPTATATGYGMPNGSGALTPPPVGSGLGSGSLPPEHVAFKPTVEKLTLKANRPVVFALYAVPAQPSPSPSPSPTGSPRSAASAGPSASPSPAALASATPSAASPASAQPAVTALPSTKPAPAR